MQIENFLKGEQGRGLVRLITIILILLAVFIGVKTIAGIKNLDYIDPAYNTISVTGEGEVDRLPDIASFTATVSAEAAEVGDAQSKVTKSMDEIIKGLKDLVIEDKDIKTTDYSVWPKYTYQTMPCSRDYCPPSKQIPDGYTVSHTVLIKIRKTENAGKALALVGEKGATNVSNITFSADDPTKAIEVARAKPIAEAKSKAKALSKDLGVRLVRVINY